MKSFSEEHLAVPDRSKKGSCVRVCFAADSPGAIEAAGEVPGQTRVGEWPDIENSDGPAFAYEMPADGNRGFADRIDVSPHAVARTSNTNPEHFLCVRRGGGSSPKARSAEIGASMP